MSLFIYQLPPIRNETKKKKPKPKKPQKKPVGSKAKIKGFDFKSWDKFNVVSRYCTVCVDLTIYIYIYIYSLHYICI